jgi:putative transposase
MPRRRRIEAPNLVRHVMSRGNGKMKIFLDDVDYQRFHNLLGRVLQDSDIQCWNYCIMPNHYHLTVQPAQLNLSEAIQRLNGEYGMWWNRRHGRVGHVFQGRFKDQIVDQQAYLLTLCRYVVMNPVRAGLVDRPELWRWSSYRATAGIESAPPFVALDATLKLFGGGGRDCHERYVRFVNSTTEDSTVATDLIRSNETVLGSGPFRAYVSMLVTKPTADSGARIPETAAAGNLAWDKEAEPIPERGQTQV